MVSIVVAVGCAAPALEMPRNVPPIVKEYKYMTLYGNHAGMVDTGIYCKRGEAISVLTSGSLGGYSTFPQVTPDMGWPLMMRIGEDPYFRPLPIGTYGSTLGSPHSGKIYLGIRKGTVDAYGHPENPDWYRFSTGFFSVTIIVWENDDWIQIAGFFEKMKGAEPGNQALIHAFDQATKIKEIVLASKKVSEEIEETKKEITELKGEPDKEKEQAVKVRPEDKPRIQDTAPKRPEVDREKQARVSQLEDKLKKLMETVGQLEKLKAELQEEREKSTLLAKKLEGKEKQEKELLIRLKDRSKSPPVIVIAYPGDETKVEVKIIHLSGVVEDEKGVTGIEIFINGKPVESTSKRGIYIIRDKGVKRLDLQEKIVLSKGLNEIKLRAFNEDGLTSEKTLRVHYVERGKNVWAVVIGINEYSHIRKLKYAVNDARLFHHYLINWNHLPAENVILLLDREASLKKLRSTLGTDLKNKAGQDDMVIIFFAGHGATERDAMSPDGDGLEKYLLPHDADPKDFYATALPMEEVSKIFNRIRSERLVFIADTCYSGASGGRTINIVSSRASLSDAFLTRICSGKGRIILSASGANEVSAENDELKHGVFTYHLIEGLKGKADYDRDGVITVDEVYRYVSEQVPLSTGQEQHPVRKGTVEGRLILGVVE